MLAFPLHICMYTLSTPVQAKAIYLHPKEFSVEEGHLTPTQKLVRRKIEASFSTQIEEMYASLP